MSETIQKYSAGGVVIAGDQVLTIKWLSKDSIEFPKGTIEAGETHERTAIREVGEETGYQTKIIDSLGDITFEFDWTDGLHYRKTVYYFLMELANNDEPVPNREDSEDFENNWLTFEQAAELLTHDDSKEVLSRAVALIQSRK